MGPAVGFVLAYICLNVYIDPAKTPVISKKDPRWLGAWWLGWILLGTIMFLFALLMAMFPQHLPILRGSKLREDEALTGNGFQSNVLRDSKVEIPTFKGLFNNYS